MNNITWMGLLMAVSGTSLIFGVAKDDVTLCLVALWSVLIWIAGELMIKRREEL